MICHPRESLTEEELRLNFPKEDKPHKPLSQHIVDPASTTDITSKSRCTYSSWIQLLGQL